MFAPEVRSPTPYFDQTSDVLYVYNISPREVVAYDSRDFLELFRSNRGLGDIRFPSVSQPVQSTADHTELLSRPELVTGEGGETVLVPAMGQFPVGVTIKESSDVTTVSETGTSDLVAIVLDSRPDTDVVFRISSSDVSEVICRAPR